MKRVATPRQGDRWYGYPLSRLRPGIAARYYEGERFERQKLQRVDPQIDFFFGTGSPDPAVGNDHFSARWTGFFKPPIAGRYRLVTYHDPASPFDLPEWP